MRQRLFFGLHLNLGAKFRTEIELLTLTKLRKNISPPRNLLYEQKIDAYVPAYNNTSCYQESILQNIVPGLMVSSY